MEIPINGQPYDGWASVPDQHRSKLAALQADSTGSGIPDLFDGEGRLEVTIRGDSVSVSPRQR